MPLFLFKSFNSKPEELKFSFTPISLSDIPELVFKDLNIKSKNTRSLLNLLKGNQNQEPGFLGIIILDVSIGKQNIFLK